MIEPHFDIDFARGKVGEDLVATFLADLQGKKIEVKTDYRAGETGNLYIETWQYSKPDASDKRPSGINITQADYYCFASPTGNGFIMITTEALKEILRGGYAPETRQPIINKNTNGSIGRLVRVTDVLTQLGLYAKR